MMNRIAFFLIERIFVRYDKSDRSVSPKWAFEFNCERPPVQKKKHVFLIFLTSAGFKKRHLLEVKQIIKYKRFELLLCDVRYIVLMMI